MRKRAKMSRGYSKRSFRAGTHPHPKNLVGASAAMRGGIRL